MCILPGQVSIVLVPVVDGIQDNRKCVDDCTNKNAEFFFFIKKFF